MPRPSDTPWRYECPICGWYGSPCPQHDDPEESEVQADERERES